MKTRDANVLITGGAQGIGLAFAQHLQRCGARCWVVDRNQDALASVKNSFASCDPPIVGLCYDVGFEDQVTECVELVEKQSQGIDVLINNAAVLRDQALVAKLGKRLKMHTLEDWNETIRSNLTGAFLVAREVAGKMIQGQRTGLVVNVSSISRHGNRGQSAYSATKSAIDALTVTWSQELAFYGIRVVAIAPGFVETQMTRNVPAMFLEQLKRNSPSQRFGTLEEFGHAIQFVIENDYLNGKVLELDGGLRF